MPIPEENNLVWKEPWKLRVPAFAITNSLYYVGNRGVSCYLIRSDKGMALIDTAFSQTTYLLTESIRTLEIDPAEISWILHTHGHVDHCGGTRRMKELTGAKVALGQADVETVERGTALTCAQYMYGIEYFETFKVDRSLQHLDTIDLGEVLITCHHTPGHTRGTMSFTLDTEVNGKQLTAGLFGGPGLWTLMDEHRSAQGYPGNRGDFWKTLQYLKTLQIDVWLAPHPDHNRTFEKYSRLKSGASPSPFIDGIGWKQFLAQIESDFRHHTGQ